MDEREYSSALVTKVVWVGLSLILCFLCFLWPAVFFSVSGFLKSVAEESGQIFT